MNYIKTFALILSISILTSLTSCADHEDFPADVYSSIETKGSEPTDTTATRKISIVVDEPEVEDIDYSVTIP